MHTEIDASPATEECPSEKAEGDGTTTEDGGEKGGDGKGVGGVRGEKTVGTTTIAVHNVDGIWEIGVVGGTPSGDEGLADGGGHLIAEEHAK